MDLINAKLQENKTINTFMGRNNCDILFAYGTANSPREIRNKNFIFINGNWRELDKEFLRKHLLRKYSDATCNKIWNLLYNVDITTSDNMETKFKAFKKELSNILDMHIGYEETCNIYKLLEKLTIK